MQLNKTIDHTMLKPQMTNEDADKLCQEAVTHNFFSVCVPPSFVAFCNAKLKDSNVQVCTVIGFPHGNSLSSTKALEAKACVDLGASEIDMVMNISALKNKDYALVEKDIVAVVSAVQPKVVKVIIETALLTSEEKITAAKICEKAGATFVKTSTGFNGDGAQLDD
ncbi:MAG: deoxyribose-phosphate aldolase, partial [Pseudobdellovibrionaceae bacterium]